MSTPASSGPAFPSILNYPSATAPHVVAQGAEAILYRSTYLLPDLPCALKYRPSKPYRHPILDARLTKHRILSEARVLVKCRREGVSVPSVYALDEASGWLMLEWIEGDMVKVRIDEWIRRRSEDQSDDQSELLSLMSRIGEAVGKLHGVGMVHGDLTTSNLMLRPKKGASAEELQNSGVLDGEIVLIDFGLANQNAVDEERAVDLYVLERAFGSTHPKAEHIFPEVLSAYVESYKGADVVLRKLEDVRMRGRKRSMLG